MALPVALLKSLWTIEGDFSTSLVAKYQCNIADAIAAPVGEASEAEWWLSEPTEDMVFL